MARPDQLPEGQDNVVKSIDADRASIRGSPLIHAVFPLCARRIALYSLCSLRPFLLFFCYYIHGRKTSNAEDPLSS